MDERKAWQKEWREWAWPLSHNTLLIIPPQTFLFRKSTKTCSPRGPCTPNTSITIIKPPAKVISALYTQAGGMESGCVYWKRVMIWPYGGRWSLRDSWCLVLIKGCRVCGYRRIWASRYPGRVRLSFTPISISDSLLQIGVRLQTWLLKKRCISGELVPLCICSSTL